MSGGESKRSKKNRKKKQKDAGKSKHQEKDNPPDGMDPTGQRGQDEEAGALTLAVLSLTHRVGTIREFPSCNTNPNPNPDSSWSNNYNFLTLTLTLTLTN